MVEVIHVRRVYEKFLHFCFQFYHKLKTALKNETFKKSNVLFEKQLRSLKSQFLP